MNVRYDLRPTVCGLLCVTLTGCALLPLPQRRRTVGPPSGSAAILDDGYEDYAGVIHIHTRYSHDAHGTFEDAIRVGNAQDLNYLIFTEHNTLQPLRDGRQGWHGAVLALIGAEVSTRGGHYLALNVTQEIDRNTLTTQQVIDEVNRQGGLGFIAHPYFKKRRWTDWSVTGFTGIEGYNVAHDTLDENKLRLALWTIASPTEPFYASILTRPYDPLATWDTLITRHGRVVGIGSSDAHEFHAFGVKFAPYEIMFRLSRTHLLIPSTPLTAEAVYDALREGHAYFSIELLAQARGFMFCAAVGEQVLGIMGDTVPLQSDLRLTVSLPTSAHLTLFKDGQRVATTFSYQWDVPVTEPGVYRLEAMREGKPWIFSNPIYVRAVSVEIVDDGQSAVSHKP